MGTSNNQSPDGTTRKAAIKMEQEMLIDSSQFKTKKSKANAKQLMQLLKQQAYRCALSGIELTPETAVIDHKIPVSRGGGNEIENLQWLHEDVNRAKGVLSQDQFLKVCRLVSQYTS
jgi:5-methylcytosine-specific restriction endonuclease McrA